MHQDLASQWTFDNPESSTCANRWSFSDSGSSLCLVAAMASGWVRPQNNTAPLTMSRQVITGVKIWLLKRPSTTQKAARAPTAGASQTLALLCLVAAMASGWVRPQNNTAPLTMSRQVITGAHNYPTLPAHASRSGFSNDLRQPRKQHVRQPLELLRLWLFSLSCGSYGFWVG